MALDSWKDTLTLHKGTGKKMVKHCWMRHVGNKCIFKKKPKMGCAMSNEKHLVKKKPKSGSLQGELPMQHLAITAWCSLSSSKKAHALSNTNNTTQGQQGKVNNCHSPSWKRRICNIYFCISACYCKCKYGFFTRKNCKRFKGNF